MHFKSQPSASAQGPQMRGEIHVAVPANFVAVVAADGFTADSPVIEAKRNYRLTAVDRGDIERSSKPQNLFAIGAGGFRKNRNIQIVFESFAQLRHFIVNV